MILVVEDNALSLKLFGELLRSRGYAYITASRGMDALELARAHRPTLVLMDMQLPDVYGLDVVKLMKADPVLKETSIIAVTASAMVGDREKFISAGCDDYISKPIRMADFLALIDKWFKPGL
jgi:two-component system, cell cycle response regulator DivK